eukprot:gene22157-25111_t
MTIDGPSPDGLAKLGKLTAIVAIHAGLFYLLQTGMLRDAVHAVLPQVVNVSFVAPPAPQPEPPAPKTVPVMQQAPAITPPPLHPQRPLWRKMKAP